MFREKLKKNTDERGYLYIRETIYSRDKRTLKRKPKKLCDGTASSQRGRYSKKKDIYCGQIIEVNILKLDNFESFVNSNLVKDEKLKKFRNYEDLILNIDFDSLIDYFVEYIIYIYEINYDDFFDEKKKKSYNVGNGYISPIIISYLKRFKVNGNFDSPSEFKRFFYRCNDCGIFDDYIIEILYRKLIPTETNIEDLNKEIKILEEQELIDKKKQENFRGFKNFIKGSIDK